MRHASRKLHSRELALPWNSIESRSLPASNTLNLYMAQQSKFLVFFRVHIILINSFRVVSN